MSAVPPKEGQTYEVTGQVTTTTGGVTYYHPANNPPPYTADPPAPGPTFVQPVVAVPVQHVLVGNAVGSKPQSFNCRHCNNDVVTKISFKPSIRTHLFALLLCVLGCWPCVCVPYCVDSCNNVEHSCPNCGVHIGTYQH